MLRPPLCLMYLTWLLRLMFLCIYPKYLDALTTIHTCSEIWKYPFYCPLICLKYCWMRSKQCRPRSDVAVASIWSGSTLFAQTSLSQYLGLLRHISCLFFSNFSPILLPLQSSMTVTLPSSTDSLSNHNPFPGNLVFIKRFEDTVSELYHRTMSL